MNELFNLKDALKKPVPPCLVEVSPEIIYFIESFSIELLGEKGFSKAAGVLMSLRKSSFPCSYGVVIEFLFMVVVERFSKKFWAV